MERAKRLMLAGRAGWIWFGLCAAYLVVRVGVAGGDWGVLSALREEAAWTLLLICSFFAAVFHRLGKRRNHVAEHPVTRHRHYLSVCRMSPFVGAIGGGLAVSGPGWADRAHWMAAGTVLTVGFVRLILTPLLYMAETLLPSSRSHRATRVATARLARREAQAARERALADIEAETQEMLKTWNDALMPRARELVRMAITGPEALEAHRGRIVDIGIEAWQLGGVECMRHLHAMAAEAASEGPNNGRTIDFIGPCWEGIGHW